MSEIDVPVAHRLDGKVALIVGGGQTPGEAMGNGRATAVLVARAGASVVVADRHLHSAQDTADLITDEGGQASAVAIEVTDDDQHRAAVTEIVSEHGRLDILHNNVGVSIAGGDADALDLDPDTFDRLWQINLKGMWMAARHAVPVMREQGSGSVVNISSMAARLAYPLVAYKTTKVAVLGLTENLAATNAGHGVRVNAILPGLKLRFVAASWASGPLLGGHGLRDHAPATRSSHRPAHLLRPDDRRRLRDTGPARPLRAQTQTSPTPPRRPDRRRPRPHHQTRTHQHPHRPRRSPRTPPPPHPAGRQQALTRTHP
ncbi:MAG: SDR family oxidoreductase [Actinomycetia bacterium]|nr:SDR family oxidoreductase [Actinomycetes bacterium]